MNFASTLAWRPFDAFILIALLSCSWFTVHYLYNFFLHPLRHLPGPFLAKFSQLPSAYHAWKGDRHIWLQQCFAKYGSKVRVEPNNIVFLSPTASRAIYGSKANVRRADLYNAFIRRESERSTITTIDNAAHAKRRKLLDLAFTNKSLRASAVFMERHIDRWNELLLQASAYEGGEWSDALNFTDWIDWLVFDILGDLCFGKSFEIKEPGENPIREMPHAITKAMRVLYTIVRSPIGQIMVFLRPFGSAYIFDALKSKAFRRFRAFLVSSVNERIEQHIAFKKGSKSSSAREDMLHFLCEAIDPDTGLPAFSPTDIRSETSLLMIAGSDSTSVTTSGLFFYLAHYPKVHAKLTEEILNTFPTADNITPGPKLSSCKYLRACIDEAMRVSPAGLSELPRHVLPGGITIDGTYFPAGTVVGTANWTDNRNPAVYGDPDIFRPERWLAGQGGTAEEVAQTKSAFHPFTMGPFNCAGMNFALQELMLIVAKTVHRLDFRVAKDFAEVEKVPCFHLVDAYITLRDGPMLQFRRRQV